MRAWRRRPARWLRGAVHACGPQQHVQLQEKCGKPFSRTCALGLVRPRILHYPALRRDCGLKLSQAPASFQKFVHGDLNVEGPTDRAEPSTTKESSART